MHSSNKSDNPQAQAALDELARQFTWRKSARGWKLSLRSRCFGEIIADSQRGMWRVGLSRDRVSDYANLSWARSAVFEAALRDIAWEARRQAFRTPRL